MRIGIVMDPIESINIKKDSSFAMLLECQRRGYDICYMTADALSIDQGEAVARWKELSVQDNPDDWYSYGPSHAGTLSEMDAILMRKDPPFDMEYVNDTYVLERAEAAGVLIVNRPQALRDANEKLFTAHYPELCPRSVFSRDPERLLRFVKQHGRAVVKPVDSMGGDSIFIARADDPNLKVILETVGRNGERLIVVQEFVDAISEGDKRILMVNGEPVPYALARIPAGDDFRGNLAKGGRGEGRPLSEDDLRIAHALGPDLRKRGILFAGLDVIGDRLTEVNVTSPTCIRELDAQFGLNISGLLFDVVEEKVAASRR